MPTLAEAKTHLRVEIDDDDTYIQTLINAAYSFAENYTGRIISEATTVTYLDSFPTEIELKTPVISITTVAYDDTDGNPQTFTDYYLNNRDLVSVLTADKDFNFPDTNEGYENVVITYQSGYATVPEQIEQAVLLIVGSLYEQRENHIVGVAINNVPVSAEYLLSPYRIVSL